MKNFFILKAAESWEIKSDQLAQLPLLSFLSRIVYFHIITNKEEKTTKKQQQKNYHQTPSILLSRFTSAIDWSPANNLCDDSQEGIGFNSFSLSYVYSVGKWEQKNTVSHMIMRPDLEFTVNRCDEKWATLNLFFIKLHILKYGLVETMAEIVIEL